MLKFYFVEKRMYTMKKKFDEISKEIILSYTVKNTSLRKKCVKTNCIMLFY